MKNNLTDLRKEALKELLLQAKKARDKPLYIKLKLKLKQISSGESGEDTNGSN